MLNGTSHSWQIFCKYLFFTHAIEFWNKDKIINEILTFLSVLNINVNKKNYCWQNKVGCYSNFFIYFWTATDFVRLFFHAYEIADVF